MIENELLFLGLLVQGSKHGYEIKRQIEEDLMPNIGIKVKSIYYPLKRLEVAGLIEKKLGREGRWPEKQVYGITSAGKKRFDQLIGEGFVSIERPFFQMDLCLYFLHMADKTLAKRKLQARFTLLKRVSRELKKLKDKSLSQSSSTHLILVHDLDLVEAEIASTQRLIQRI